MHLDEAVLKSGLARNLELLAVLGARELVRLGDGELRASIDDISGRGRNLTSTPSLPSCTMPSTVSGLYMSELTDEPSGILYSTPLTVMMASVSVTTTETAAPPPVRLLPITIFFRR